MNRWITLTGWQKLWRVCWISFIPSTILLIIAAVAENADVNSLAQNAPLGTTVAATTGYVIFTAIAAILSGIVFWTGLVAGIGTLATWQIRKEARSRPTMPPPQAPPSYYTSALNERQRSLMQDLRQNPLNTGPAELAVAVMPKNAASDHPPELAISEIDPFAYYGWQEPHTETPKDQGIPAIRLGPSS
jgi:hypothetical protein